MIKRVFLLVSTVLIVLIFGGSIIGCKETALTPPTSSYPADIIGRVTIANTILALDSTGTKQEINPIGNDRIWWIVQVSIKNKSYQYPITSVWDNNMLLPKGVTGNIMWVIIYNGQIWSGSQLGSPQEGIQKGQSGSLWLSFESKTDFNPSDLQICYQGQEPYSYGKLVKADMVAVYDWDLKKATQTKVVAQTPLIPYGTYVASAAGFTASITFNSDGTYSQTNAFTGKTVGTYTVSKDYITIYDPITHEATQQKYTYVDKFKCLYLYSSDSDQSPMPFYKQ